MLAFLFALSVLLVFYTYAGYPLVLFFLARLRPKPKPFGEFLPSVTLLIAAYNEENAIAEKLENTLALDYPREKLQILIAADGSSDRTVEIVQSFANRDVELSYSPERGGKMAAIDRAIDAVRGEILVLSDANNMYAPNTVRMLVAPFQDLTVGATGGAKQVLEGDGALGDSEGAYWRYESWVKKQETRLGCATGAAGEANALRRSLYVSPPHDTINDDFFLMMQVLRQGYRMIYVPEAQSFERVSASARDEIERRTRIVAGRYQAIARSRHLLPFRHPLWVWQVVSHKYLRPLVPFFMILAFVTALATVIWPSTNSPALLWLGAPWNWVALGAQIAFYLAAWLGTRIGDSGKIGKLFYLATFLVNSNFAALLGFWRFVSRGQKTQWKRAQRRGE
jgi:cellulose synthase/poly-beta-1,6-N-acetylglucosamine synthase-like glycosyltransferase